MNNENIHELVVNDKNIILVGTAHVSEVSANLVKEAINHYQPDTVCIELDDERLKTLKNPSNWEDKDIKSVIKNKQTFQLLASIILSSYQQRMAAQLNTQVGLEMVTAINLAEELNIPITTIDRDVKITFKRIWNSLSFKEKTELLGVGFSSVFENDEEVSEDDLQALLEEDALGAALSEIRNQVPTIARILVDERDQYLANKIRNAKGDKILAVVGGAHIPGIKEELYKEQNMVEINSIPPKAPTGKYISWIMFALLAAILILPFFNGLNEGVIAIAKWSLFASSGAAIASLIIGAHPLSALAAFLSAPIAALHPILAVGFVAAFAEATLRKPTVKDVERISEDIQSFKGWRSNQFIRILALVLVANLGSVVGQIISGLSIVKNLIS